MKTTPLDSFNYWYNNTGHWVYESREEALAVWRSVGIEGLPNP